MQQHRPAAGWVLGALAPGERKLEGKSFFLDEVKRRRAEVLVETISELGGKVESFLNKDVSFVVTGSPDGLRNRKTEVLCGGSDDRTKEASKQRKGAISIVSKQRPDTPRQPVYGSRGKALLEKAIRNNERLLGSTVLANARSWGVKIVHVDDLLPYVQWLRAENSVKHKESQPKNARKNSVAPVVKATALRVPYLKVEDSSRRYKPLHVQSMVFPGLYYSGCYSPFEPAPPPQLEQSKVMGPNKPRVRTMDTSQEKPETPVGLTPSPCWARKKNVGYCECCHQPFKDQEEHLQTEQHRSFVLESSNYDVVDQLVAEMRPGFDPHPAPELTPALMRDPSPSPAQAFSPQELEMLPDVETEQAIRALLTQDPMSNGVCQLLKPPSRPPSPPTDAQALRDRPHAAQLDERPPPLDTLHQPLSPYSQPPMLSHCMDSSDTPRPDAPYLDPPVLSPQVQRTPPSPLHPTLAEHVRSPSVFVEGQLIPQRAVAIADGGGDGVVKEAVQKNLVAKFNRLKCAAGGNSECAGGSCSCPRVDSATPNPRKRHRAASPQRNAPKRRRTSGQTSEAISGCRTGGMRQEEMSSARSTSSESGLVPQTSHRQTGPPPLVVYGHTDHVTVVEQPGVNRGSILTAHTHKCEGLWHTPTPPGCRTTVPTSRLAERACPRSQTAPAFSVEELSSEHQTLAKSLLPNVDNIPRSSNREMFAPTPVLSSRKQTCCSQDPSPPFSVCIESALVPDMATLSPSSSDSDWDCHLLSRLSPTPAVAPPRPQGRRELDLELLQKPCTWTHNTSYESHLYSVLQPPTPPASLCGEGTQRPIFARVLIQRIEVQH